MFGIKFSHIQIFFFQIQFKTLYKDNGYNDIEINYSYSIDLIKEINELQSTNNDKIYKKC